MREAKGQRPPEALLYQRGKREREGERGEERVIYIHIYILRERERQGRETRELHIYTYLYIISIYLSILSI